MRTVRRLLLILGAGFAVLLIGGFMLRQQLARLIIRRTVVRLNRVLNGQISYEAIRGDIFSHPEILNLTVAVGSDTYNLELVRVKYDLLSLLRRRLVFRDVMITGFDIRIAERAGGGQPTFRRFNLPAFAVHRLTLENCRIFYHGERRVDSAGLILALAAGGSHLELKLDSVHCRLVREQISILQGRALITLLDDTLAVRDLEIVTPASHLAAEGCLNLPSGALEVTRAELELSFDELFKTPGYAQLKLKARQSAGERQVDVSGWAEGLVAGRVKLPRLDGRCQIDDSVLVLTVSGRDQELGEMNANIRFSLPNSQIEAVVVAQRVPVRRLTSALPDFVFSTRLDVSGRLRSLGELLPITSPVGGGDSLEIRLTGAAQELGVETLAAVVTYRDQTVELRELFLDGPAGRFRFLGRAKRGLLAAQCEMTGFDLSVAGRFLNQHLSGRADGRLEVIIDGDSWRFSGLVRVDGFAIGRVEVTTGLIQAGLSGRGPMRFRPGDLVSGRVAVGGEGVKLAGWDWNWAQFVWTGPEFDLQFESDSIHLSVLGDISPERGGVSAVVRSLNLIVRAETVSLADSATVVLGPEEIRINGGKLELAGGEMEFGLNMTHGTTSGLFLNARQLSLHKVARIAGLDLECAGTAELSVSGSEPFNVDLRVAGLEIPAAGVKLSLLTGGMTVFRESINVDYIKFVHHTDTSEIKGVLAYTLYPKFAVDRATATLNLADPGSWVLMFTRPYVEIPEGRIYALIRADWQPGMLMLSGRARVDDGVLIVPSVAARVERIQAELTLQQDRIVLEKLSGLTTRGVLTAEGFAQLNSDWQVESLRYQTRFTGASAVPIPGVYAIGNGDITVSWQEGEYVLISGEVTIDDALATIGFGGAPGGSGNGGEVNYDLRVRGERGIWLRNPQADIELSVDLTVRKFGTEVLYSGEMLSRQGRIYYLDHTLRLTSGRLLFDNVSSFNPQLDLTAELPVPVRRSNGPDRLKLRVTGSLLEPVFAFAAEPPVWDETQIITYLSLNVIMDEFSAMEQKELISRLLAERLLGYFETQVSKRVRDYISLDYLELETGITGREAARVTVGKYVTPNLYVSYTQSFADNFQPAFRIEYYFNRRNELVAERAADGRYSLRYRFKLRF